MKWRNAFGTMETIFWRRGWNHRLGKIKEYYTMSVCKRPYTSVLYALKSVWSNEKEGHIEILGREK